MPIENNPERPKVEDYLSEAEKEKLRVAGLVPEGATEHQAADSGKTARIEEITEAALQAEQQALKEADLLTQGYEEYSRRVGEARDKSLAKVDELTQGDTELKRAALKRLSDIRDGEAEENMKKLEILQETETGGTNKQKETEPEQPDSHVAEAVKTYQETLKEGGKADEAETKAWDKLMELAGSSGDFEPFEKLGEELEKLKASAPAVQKPEIKLQTADPGEAKESSEEQKPWPEDWNEQKEAVQKKFNEKFDAIAADLRERIDALKDKADKWANHQAAAQQLEKNFSYIREFFTNGTDRLITPENLPRKKQEAEEILESFKKASQEVKDKAAADAPATEGPTFRENITDIPAAEEKSETASQPKPDIIVDRAPAEKAARAGLPPENLPIAESPGAKPQEFEKTKEIISSNLEALANSLETARDEQAKEIIKIRIGKNMEALRALDEQAAVEYDRLFSEIQAPEEIQPQTEDERRALQEIQPELEKMPEEEREKLGIGFNNFGFFIKEKTNGFFAETFKRLADKTESRGIAGRFLTASLSESYKNDSEDARKKMEDIAATGKKSTLGNVGYLTGNIMKIGRTAADFVGWTAASPLRYATIIGQTLERGLDVAKEARLKNEDVLEKTRIKDIATAQEEALKIYDQAQAKVGEKEISAKDLERAYQENIPQDLIKRLKENAEPNEASSFLQGVFKKHIESSANRLQKKIGEIEAKSDLPEKEKSAQIERLFNNYSKKLKDFDRVLSQYGTVDTAAMLAKYGSEASKWAVRGVMVESLYLGLEKLWEGKIWHDLAKVVHGRLESPAPGTAMEHTTEQKQALEEYRQKFAEKFAATAPKSEITPPQPELTPSAKHFEDIIDSSKVSGGDSVWKSTKELFVNHAKELKYDGDPNDKAALDKWAETQTANSIKELADKEYGGKMPDLVHGPSAGGAGDKVIVELGADGKPHLKFEAASGIKPGYLEHEAAGPAKTPLAEVSPGQQTRPDDFMELEPPGPKIPLAESPADKLKTAFETSGPTDMQEKQEALKNYLTEVVANKDNYLNFSKEKINVFARMFPIDGVAQKIEDLDTPNELARAIRVFDEHIQSATRQLLDGELQHMPANEGTLPVENKNYELFIAQPVGNGEWQLWRPSVVEGKFTYMPAAVDPIVKINLKFKLEDLKTFLRY